MKTILEIFDVDKNNPGGGINRHVSNLCTLFSDDADIKLSVAIWKHISYNRLINKTYLKKQELFQTISGFDSIHIHGFASLIVWQVFRVALKLKKNIYYSPHYHPFAYLNHPFKGKIFFFFLIRPYLKKAKAIFTINNEDTKFFQRYSNSCYKIPHWGDKVCNMTNEIKIPNRICFVGKNTKDKGLEYLYKLPYNMYDVHCVTNGKLQRDDFVQHANISDIELRKLYSSASVLVVPSRYEAFSYVALEALLNSTPVLLSDRVQIYDYLNDLECCKTFKYGDFNDFFIKISIVIGKKVCVDKIRSVFSAEKAKIDYKKIFLM